MVKSPCHKTGRPGAHGLASGVGHRFGIVEIIFVVEIAVDDLCAVLGINAVPAAAFKTVFAHNAGRRPDEIIGFVAQDQPALFGLFGGGVEKFLQQVGIAGIAAYW